MILILSDSKEKAKNLQKFLLKNGIFCNVNSDRDTALFSSSACIALGGHISPVCEIPTFQAKNEKDSGILSFIEKYAPYETESYSYKQLTVGNTRDNVFYLGYPLTLTNTEFAILRLFAKFEGNNLSAETIADYCALSGSSKSVSLHIFNINGKAKEIGGRTLIKNNQKSGYFLNNEM